MRCRGCCARPADLPGTAAPRPGPAWSGHCLYVCVCGGATAPAPRPAAARARKRAHKRHGERGGQRGHALASRPGESRKSRAQTLFSPNTSQPLRGEGGKVARVCARAVVSAYLLASCACRRATWCVRVEREREKKNVCNLRAGRFLCSLSHSLLSGTPPAARPRPRATLSLPKPTRPGGRAFSSRLYSHTRRGRAGSHRLLRDVV